MQAMDGCEILVGEHRVASHMNRGTCVPELVHISHTKPYMMYQCVLKTDRHAGDTTTGRGAGSVGNQESYTLQYHRKRVLSPSSP